MNRSSRVGALWVSALRVFVLILVPVMVMGSALSGCSGGDETNRANPASTGSRDSAGPAAGPTDDDDQSHNEAPFTTVEEAVNFERPVVLAHAGGENAHPHSTMFAYSEAVKAGVDILDFDVRLTKDNVLVVFHDDTVDRTTDGTGRVDEMTWEQLQALDGSYWFTEACSACKDRPENEYIYRGMRTGDKPTPKGYSPADFAPTRLSDVIEKYPDFVLNIEIKGSFPDSVPVAQELARELEQHDKLDSSIVTAFDDKLVDAFHELSPTVEITPGLAAMTDYVLKQLKPADGRRIMQIPPEYEGIKVLTPELVERAHTDGMVLWIWPNEREWENAEGYHKLLEMGVDGLNAADPAVAVRAVREFVAGD